MTDLPALGSLIGPYLLKNQLGQGGVATVYRATHQVLGSDHAIKLLNIPVKSLRRRLLLEGQIQARLRHPNVVSATDAIEWNGLPGLVLEFVDGPDLQQLIAAGPRSVAQLDDLAKGMLAGVQAVHEAGYAHRDLKPGNVLLQPGVDGPVPRLADFGLARIIDRGPNDGRTRDGVTMGTPAYMSPEQVQDARDADHRTDVWAVGCILYELATGCSPFASESAFETMTSVTHARPQHPRDLRPELPERMVDAILGCLVKDRERRVQCIDDLRGLWTGQRLPGVAAASSRAQAWSAKELVNLPPRPTGTHLDALVSGKRSRKPTHLHALLRPQRLRMAS